VLFSCRDILSIELEQTLNALCSTILTLSALVRRVACINGGFYLAWRAWQANGLVDAGSGIGPCRTTVLSSDKIDNVTTGARDISLCSYPCHTLSACNFPQPGGAATDPLHLLDSPASST